MNEKYIHFIIVSQYLYRFISLEKHLRELIKDEIIKIDPLKKNKLYFYHGSKAGSKVWANFQNLSLNFQGFDFKANEEFKDFTLKSLVDFCQAEKINFLNKDIHSFNNKMVVQDNYTTIKALIEMRNMLAHELANPTFTSKHVIEILSDEILQKNLGEFLSEFELKNLNDESKKILSNLIYLEMFFL